MGDVARLRPPLLLVLGLLVVLGLAHGSLPDEGQPCAVAALCTGHGAALAPEAGPEVASLPRVVALLHPEVPAERVQYGVLARRGRAPPRVSV